MATVSLITHTPTPEIIVAAAAKLCYSSTDTATVLENLTQDKAESFVEMLSTIGHESPIEHVSFTFGIDGVSRALLAQITRHRIASYSVQSQRYVKENTFEYVVPPEISAIPKAKEEFLRAMDLCNQSYEKLTAILKQEHYQRLLSEGKDEKDASKQAQKLAIEDARFVLPNACDTKMIVTMNARSLQNFFKHRCCNRAQWEIRDVAKEMYRLVYGVAPSLFESSGPACLRGKCPEGSMTCGKMLLVQNEYAEIKRGINK